MAIYAVRVDGVDYEADTIDQLAQWTAEGRLAPDSVITDTGTGITFTVAEHPQLRRQITAQKPIDTAPTPTAQTQRQIPYTPVQASVPLGTKAAASNKVAAGVCAILFNCLGVHKFMLGYTTEGILMLLISLIGGVCTCGFATMAMMVIGVIEGIIYLTKTDEDFVRTYVQNKRGWL